MTSVPKNAQIRGMGQPELAIRAWIAVQDSPRFKALRARGMLVYGDVGAVAGAIQKAIPGMSPATARAYAAACIKVADVAGFSYREGA